jgi:hypothetical protein
MDISSGFRTAANNPELSGTSAAVQKPQLMAAMNHCR